MIGEAALERHSCVTATRRFRPRYWAIGRCSTLEYDGALGDCKYPVGRERTASYIDCSESILNNMSVLTTATHDATTQATRSDKNHIQARAAYGIESCYASCSNSTDSATKSTMCLTIVVNRNSMVGKVWSPEDWATHPVSIARAVYEVLSCLNEPHAVDKQIPCLVEHSEKREHSDRNTKLSWH